MSTIVMHPVSEISGDNLIGPLILNSVFFYYLFQIIATLCNTRDGFKYVHLYIYVGI